MQTLRHMTRQARLVLAVFLLSLGAAIAAPAVTPQRLEMVCAGGVFKLVLPEGAGVSSAPSALDCPLCVPAGVPPVMCVLAAFSGWDRDRLPLQRDGHRGGCQSAMPPPARAPPVDHTIVS
jgi:hypothetical protein